MTEKNLRAGVIGLGIGASHVRGYLAAPGVELAALCDSNPQRLAEIGAQYGVPAEAQYTDYATMLSEANLDIVSVCPPNALHAPMSIQALEAGAHVLCEKPLAASTAEARQMMAAARKAGRRLMVAYNHRYRPDVAWIRRLIDGGRLGRIYHVEAHWRRETGIPGWGWFGSQEMSGGGALIDLGVHVLDMALWLMGYPAVESVTGTVRRLFGARGQKVWGLPRWMSDKSAAFDVEDGGIGFVRLAGNTSLVLHATWAEHRAPNDDLIHLELEGSEGTAVLHIPNYTRDDTLTFYTHEAGLPVTVRPKLKWEGKHGHEALIIDLVEAMRAGQPSPTDAAQGLEGVRVVEAIYQASESGREVRFDAPPTMLA